MGKVHGSLARAGKVKAATPKVAKQEKKKKQTGRARKRYLYNLRYASLKKGTDTLRIKPNSQASQIAKKEFKEAQALRISRSKAEKG
eukprot:CAMPEP_0117448916 /NCGR_PEP_ID=MMETSP0759-20121206/7659_1 /TAXON_ID=63605 /ORGANISM="Percolomonas cosmopolitus, Strain WS" /LENGTH=86 /DNA_ID=CAMNT_0005241341 /DNA_START=49 /DNA_END=306 /DNA_ORIENTATION=+